MKTDILPPLVILKTGRWLHFKGAIYEVTGTRRFEPMPWITLVDYYDPTTGERWSRPVLLTILPDGTEWPGFLDKVDAEGLVQRFAPLPEEEFQPIGPESFPSIAPEVWQFAKWQNLQKRGIQEEADYVPIPYVKTHPDAKVPTHGQEGDAGADYYALEGGIIPARGRVKIRTGIAIAIPAGRYGKFESRSGLSAKHGVEVGAGTIDNRHRQEISIVLYNHTDTDYPFEAGDRLAQLVVRKFDRQQYVERDALPETNRTEGWGSSGR